MFQKLEIALLTGFRDFFALDAYWGFLVFWFIGGIFFVIQFSKKAHDKTHVTSGLIGFSFLSFGFLHTFYRKHVVDFFNEKVLVYYFDPSFQTPMSRDMGPLEPLFSLLIAPSAQRNFFDEILFLLVISYIGSVLYHSFQAYKKTGIVLAPGSLNIFSGKSRRPQRSKSNELGSGDMASAEDLINFCRPTSDPEERKYDTYLDVKNLRGSEGVSVKQGQLTLSRDQRNKHMLIIAKTGGGKTTSLIQPVLYNDCMSKHRSTIIIDSKPEFWGKLSNFCQEFNPEKKLLRFNPLETGLSHAWNIIAKVEDDTDCKLIANTIVMATDNPSAKSDSPFFRNNALSILNAIMVGLLHDEGEKLSMPRVHELVQSGMKPLGDWLEAHPEALRTSRTFVELARSGSQNADTIMSELSMRLSAWDLKAIRATTSMEEIDLDMLIEEPTLFIVEFRESELEMLRPMANVIVVELLRFLTKKAESFPGHCLPRPVGFVIDEFASALGRLPDIHVKLNTLRSRNVSITAAIQSIGQVKANYGDDADSVLAGFNTKIFLPPLDLTDAEWASKETGQMTIRFKTKSSGSNQKLTEFFASNNDSVQEQVQQRAVLTPDEVGKPPREDDMHDNEQVATFFFPAKPVFQGTLRPWYLVQEKRKMFEAVKGMPEIQVRTEPIHYEEAAPVAAPSKDGASGGGAAGGLPAGITNVKGWSEEDIRKKLEEVKKNLEWENTTGSAKKWWEAFENENAHRVALVLRLAEELQNRKATITEFFLAYVYSNTDNIQANLHYLDYTRLKKEEERKKKEAAQQAKQPAAAAVNQ